jgi:hypothetical protein
MSWASDELLSKAKLYASRANGEAFESALFGMWMSLSLELLARAALAKIHPVLLADPTTEGNIHYAFGINPKTNPKSVAAKAVFARCSVFIKDFTDEMSGQCLLLADRRNKELHTGEASFEGVDASTWLPQTYEVFGVLLASLGTSFSDFLGTEHAAVAEGMLKDRRDHILKEVKERISVAKRDFDKLGGDAKAERIEKAQAAIKTWVKGSLRKTCNCPACGFSGAISGEALNRGPIKVNEEEGTLSREVRALPNAFRCPACGLKLDGYQELLQAGLGKPFVGMEDEDPIEFFGIIPEEHIDIDKVIRDYLDDGYMNE